MSASRSVYRSTCVMLLLAGALTLGLSSCSLIPVRNRVKTVDTTTTVPDTSPAVEVAARPAQEGSDNTLLARCRQELTALRSVVPAAASPLTDHFDSLMQRMHQYAGFRATLSTPLQQTMDALYRYRVNKVCADIRHTLLNNLSLQAEKA